MSKLCYQMIRETQKSKSTKHSFNLGLPFYEEAMTRCFRAFRTGISKAAFGLTIAASVLGGEGCSSVHNQPADAQSTDAKKTENKLITETQSTNQNGQAIFEVDERTFKLSIYDSEELKPIKGLSVLFSLKDDVGTYFIIDAENVYLPRITGILPPEGIDGKADGATNANEELHQETNIVMTKKQTICGVMGFQYSPEQDKVPLFADEDWRKANGFELAKTVSLAELNEVVGQLVLVAAEEVTQWVAEVVIMIAYPITIPAVGAFEWFSFYVELPLSVCAVGESVDWAAYYKKLCYEDADRFAVYKWKWSIPDIPLIHTNPIFIVVPQNSKESWVPPTATIKGAIEVVDGRYALFQSFTAYIKHATNTIPTFIKPIWYSNKDNYGDFEAVVSACDNYDPTYSVEIGVGLLNENPETTLKVKPQDPEKGKPYNIKFYLNPGCKKKKDYKTYYSDVDNDGFGDEFNRVVSCELLTDSVEKGGDSNDSDSTVNPNATEVCDGIDNNSDGKTDEVVTKEFCDDKHVKTTSCKDGKKKEGECTLQLPEYSLQECTAIPGPYAAFDEEWDVEGNNAVFTSLTWIYHTNISTGETKAIPPEYGDSLGWVAHNPKIDGNKVVFWGEFSDLGNYYPRVYTYEFGADKATEIDYGSVPYADKNRIAYLSYPPMTGKNCTVKFYEADTDTIYDLGAPAKLFCVGDEEGSGSSSNMPAISGTNVAITARDYQDAYGIAWHIFVYNTKKSGWKDITASMWEMNMGVTELRADNDELAFLASKDWEHIYDVVMYNFNTDTLYNATQPFGPFATGITLDVQDGLVLFEGSTAATAHGIFLADTNAKTVQKVSETTSVKFDGEYIYLGIEDGLQRCRLKKE